MSSFGRCTILIYQHVSSFINSQATLVGTVGPNISRSQSDRPEQSRRSPEGPRELQRLKTPRGLANHNSQATLSFIHSSQCEKKIKYTAHFAPDPNRRSQQEELFNQLNAQHWYADTMIIVHDGIPLPVLGSSCRNPQTNS